MVLFDEDVLVPFLVFAIPLVAIAGGILARVIKTISSHRLMETIVRERMALVARGLDPDKLPTALGGSALMSMRDLTRLRAQGLLVGGFVTLAGGISFAAVSYALGGSWDGGDWGVGVVAASIGLALLLSGAILWPRGPGAAPQTARHGG